MLVSSCIGVQNYATETVKNLSRKPLQKVSKALQVQNLSFPLLVWEKTCNVLCIDILHEGDSQNHSFDLSKRFPLAQ